MPMSVLHIGSADRPNRLQALVSDDLASSVVRVFPPGGRDRPCIATLLYLPAPSCQGLDTVLLPF